MDGDGARSSRVAVLAVMAAALLVVLPFAFLGSPSGHDFEFHLSSWMETVSQWKQGILYPRWAALAHFGYGEARFIFYPPASWMLGAALGTVLPWSVVPAAYVWITLTLGGYCMHLLAREWLEERDAIAAALLYTVNPYHVVVVYWRSAYAELLADALFPLLLLWILRARKEPRRALLPLSLTLAMIWLSNAPAAVIATYSLVLLTVLLCALDKSWRALIYAGAAIVLALALAAFYIIPAAWEQKWVNIGEILSLGVRPRDNFLFAKLADPEHNVFNLLVSSVAAGEIVVLALATLLVARWRRDRRELWWTLIGWAAISVLLMLPITNWLWAHLPKLEFVQLPWRWLVPFNVAFAIVVAGGIRRIATRTLFAGFLLAAMLLLSNRILPPWWDTAEDIIAMHQAVVDGRGYEGTDEYVPKGADPYELKMNAPKVEVLSEGGAKAGDASINIEKWQAEARNFSVVAGRPLKLVLRLFNYPAWRGGVNGAKIVSDTREVTGQMVIPVPAGQSRVTLRFMRTADRTIGIIVSIIAVLLAALLTIGPLRSYSAQAGSRS